VKAVQLLIMLPLERKKQSLHAPSLA
jgi:hypothetical protein